MSAPQTATDTSYTKSPYVTIVFGIIAAGLYGVSFWFTSKFVGSADNWQDIQSSIPTILGPALGGAIMLFIAMALYITQMDDDKNILYIILGMACVSLVFSYVSVAVAIMSKS
jgi:hypothetical protein